MPVQSQVIVDDDHRLKCKLFIEALRAYGSARLRVSGTSMWPALWPGDTVEIRSASISQARVNELIAFTRDGRLFVHRVIAETRAECAELGTRGDALPSADAPVRDSEFLGIAKIVEQVPRSLLSRIRQAIRYRVIAPGLLRAAAKS